MNTIKNYFFSVILLIDTFTASTQEVTIKRSTIIEQYKGNPCYLHFVKQGETLTAIARTYNITIEELKVENPFLHDGLKADQVLRIPKRAEVAETIKKPEEPQIVSQTGTTGKIKTIYTVKKKETLYGISRQFNISIEELLLANPGVTSLQEGMLINIPEGGQANEIIAGEKKDLPDNLPLQIKPEGPYQEIIVQQGQTLYSLSKQHGMTVEQFLALNPDAAQGLKAESVVRVPVAFAPPGKGIPDNIQLEKTGSRVPLAEDKKVAESASGVKKDLPPDTCDKIRPAKKPYHIALLLPFALEETDSIVAQSDETYKTPGDFKAFEFFQFYSGLKIAADSLEKQGFVARIYVYDADQEGDTMKIKKVLRKGELARMDLIIGPVYARSFDIASGFAKRENIAIVNPLSKREKIIENNPGLFKVQVSEPAVARKMAGFVIDNYSGDNLILVRNGTKEMAGIYEEFISILRKNGRNGTGIPFREVNYASESFQGVTKSITPERKNRIIFFSANRSVVPNFVSLMNNFVKGREVTLFGMPGWEAMDIDAEFLVNLNYHQVVTSFIDYDSEAVKQFIRRFREETGSEPSQEKNAFLGFDIGWYFFRALMDYGREFGPCLRGMPPSGLHNDFIFQKRNPDGGYENTGCRIGKISNYKWVTVY